MKYRVSIEWKSPNENGDCFTEEIIDSKRSAMHLADYFLTKDRTDNLLSIVVNPV